MLTVDEAQRIKKNLGASKRTALWQDQQKQVLQRHDSDLVAKHPTPTNWHLHIPMTWEHKSFGKMDLVPKFEPVSNELHPKLKKTVWTPLDCINFYGLRSGSKSCASRAKRTPSKKCGRVITLPRTT